VLSGAATASGEETIFGSSAVTVARSRGGSATGAAGRGRAATSAAAWLGGTDAGSGIVARFWSPPAGCVPLAPPAGAADSGAVVPIEPGVANRAAEELESSGRTIGSDSVTTGCGLS
jgi:hypothetical protein